MTSPPGMRALAETFEAMRATRSPRMKEALLGDFLLAVAADTEALTLTARICGGRSLASGDPRSLGAGWALVMDVAAGLTGYPPAILAACARATGDLAEAVALLVERKPGAHDRPGLPLAEVARAFDHLASLSRRTDKGPALFRLLAACTPLEVKYLLRSIGGGLRIGAQETLALAAIARAFDRDAESVRWAFARTGDPGVVAVLARDDRLATAAFEIGRPAAFMLAAPRESVKSPIDPAAFIVEDKIDGVRAQVHRRGDEVSIFARGLSRVTAQFPEVAGALRFAKGPVALDGEIVAVGPGGRPRPFMVLSERIHRKAPTRAMLASIPVAFIAYDLLADDEGEALDRPWTDRRARLERFIAELGDTPTIRANPTRPMTAEDLDIAFRAARERGHEGLVLKRADAFYEAGRRTASWIKVKQAFATLDCVVTAAEEGHGKRAGGGATTPSPSGATASLLNIGKAYSGLTDAEIEASPRASASSPWSASAARASSAPRWCWRSPSTACSAPPATRAGFASSLPRIQRIRDDKLPEHADTLSDAVRAIYAAQLESGHREDPCPEPPPPPKNPPALAPAPAQNPRLSSPSISLPPHPPAPPDPAKIPRIDPSRFNPKRPRVVRDVGCRRVFVRAASGGLKAVRAGDNENRARTGLLSLSREVVFHDHYEVVRRIDPSA
ncbi:MAG: RNA ligase family protein [Polyangiaceae bacterium]